MSVEELRDILGAPPSLPVGRVPDWSAVQTTLGTPLPGDYKEFVATYGPGAIDGFIYVLAPNTTNDNLNLSTQVAARLRALREFRTSGAGTNGTPFAPLPEPEGLIPWGFTDNGDVLYWETAASHPDTWPTVIQDSRCSQWDTYGGTMTAFLAAILSKCHVCKIFPNDFPSDRVEFEPMA